MQGLGNMGYNSNRSTGINSIIKHNMKMFEENCLKYRMNSVLEVLVKNNLSIADIGEVQKHFIDIKQDIKDFFREMTEEEERAIANKYITNHSTKINLGLMDME